MIVKDLTKTGCRDKKNNLVIKKGDRIRWKTLSQEIWTGVVREIDNNVAIVKTMKGVQSIEL